MAWTGKGTTMAKFRALFVVNLKAVLLSSSMGGRGNTKRKVTGAGLLALLAFLALMMSCSYSFAFASQLAPLGMEGLVLSLMAVLATAMGAIFTVFAVQGVVFGGKDNDLMLSMPVSAFQLMLARVSALALENLVFSAFVMLPACAAYAWASGTITAGLVARSLIASVFLALLPTTLALILGFALTWLSSKLGRGKALGRNLLYFVFFGAIMAGSFRMSFLMNDLAEHAAGIQSGLTGWGLPFLLLQAGVQGAWPALAGFAALCAVPFLLAVWLFGGRYKALVTSMTGRFSRSDYKLEQQTAAGAAKALLAKECRRFFTTTMYLFNAGMGLIMAIIAGVALIFMGGEMAPVLAAFGLPAAPLLALTFGFCLSMSAVSASSVSLEGKYLWILKEAPVSTRQILRVKWGFHVLVSLPCVLVGVVCASFGCALSFGDGLALLLVCVAFVLFHAPFGLLINLCFPKLDAANETAVVKQSMAAFLGIFAPMLLIAACAGLYALLSPALGGTLTLALCGCAELLAAAVCLALADTRGVRLLDALN